MAKSLVIWLRLVKLWLLATKMQDSREFKLRARSWVLLSLFSEKSSAVFRCQGKFTQLEVSGCVKVDLQA